MKGLNSILAVALLLACGACKLEQGLSSVRKHMKEEGENLKRILESRDSRSREVKKTS